MLDMIPKEKLRKARMRLILDNPFFGALALRMRFVETEQIPTFGVYKTTIYYNASFVETLSGMHIKSIIAHELLHIALLHSVRIQTRQKMAWNMAADYAINNMLIESGFTLPKDALVDSKYKNMSSEIIYEELLKQAKSNKNNSNSSTSNDENGNSCNSSGDGDGSEIPTDKLSTGSIMNKPDKNDKGADKDNNGKTMSEKQAAHELEEEIKQLVADAAVSARYAGKLPSFVERILEDLSAPTVNWRMLLQEFLSKIKHADKCWKRPQRAFYPRIYLPSQKLDRTGDIVVAVDTSASISTPELTLFMSEISAILQTVNVDNLYVIYCDAKVQHVDHVLLNETLPITPKGGGGTDFRPVFDYIEEHQISPSALIYYTDGYGSFPSEAPQYPVLWGIFGSEQDNVDTPFGYDVPLPSPSK